MDPTRRGFPGISAISEPLPAPPSGARIRAPEGVAGCIELPQGTVPVEC
jgi:hypothetical protein